MIERKLREEIGHAPDELDSRRRLVAERMRTRLAVRKGGYGPDA
jgi:hypothetical protein